MSEDKENESSNENHWSEILDLKNEIADIYIKKAIEKWSAGSFVIWEWKNIKDYLVSENAIDKFFDKIRGNLAANVLSPLDPELVNYFTQAKETLDNYTTKEELLRLKTELSSTENTDDSQTQTTDNSSQTTNPSETPSQSSTNTPQIWTVVPIYSSYEKFKVDNDITSEDINYVNENSKYIVEKLQTKWVLTKIKEIKNKNWEVILNCKWTNPYVNSQAVVDLIWLSLLFYRKSWESLVINSWYRTVAQQAAAAAKNPDRSKVAAAGYSAHNLWYASIAYHKLCAL